MPYTFISDQYATTGSGQAASNPNGAFSVVAGDLLVCVTIVYQGGGSVGQTVTDSDSNSWSKIGSTLLNGSNAEMWYALCAHSTALTVTSTLASGVGYIRTSILQYRAAFAVSPLDKSNVGTTGTSTTPTGNSITPTQTGALVVGWDTASSLPATTTPAAGWTSRAHDGTFDVIDISDQAGVSGTPISYSATFSSSEPWTSGIASFLLAAYSIAGNAGIAGATVSYTGTASGSVTADGSGNYTIPSLANGSYTITPSLAGYSFSPTSANETVSGSNITGVNFTATHLTVATSTFSPAAGTYLKTQTVTISNTNSGAGGFAQYYTTDGSTPTTGSTLYSGPITVSVSQTVKVLAIATGYINSAIASATYTIETPAEFGGNFRFRF
jgi:chitobiase/beta-hexosaminidase-like protein